MDRKEEGEVSPKPPLSAGLHLSIPGCWEKEMPKYPLLPLKIQNGVGGDEWVPIYFSVCDYIVNTLIKSISGFRFAHLGIFCIKLNSKFLSIMFSNIETSTFSALIEACLSVPVASSILN